MNKAAGFLMVLVVTVSLIFASGAIILAQKNMPIQANIAILAALLIFVISVAPLVIAGALRIGAE